MLSYATGTKFTGLRFEKATCFRAARCPPPVFCWLRQTFACHAISCVLRNTRHMMLAVSLLSVPSTHFYGQFMSADTFWKVRVLKNLGVFGCLNGIAYLFPKLFLVFLLQTDLRLFCYSGQNDKKQSFHCRFSETNLFHFWICSLNFCSLPLRMSEICVSQKPLFLIQFCTLNVWHVWFAPKSFCPEHFEFVQ